MAQWVNMKALANEDHAPYSNQPEVGWSRTDMRSMRDFSSFISIH